MKIGDNVFVVNWSKHYSELKRWNNGAWEQIFPIKTKLPDYCGIEYHWKQIWKDNLTLKGSINKREPKILVEKLPVYKDYKWEVVEIFKHPNAGQPMFSKESIETWKLNNTKYTENNLLLLASTHTDKEWMKCYIVIEETGVSKLTPEQYANEQFNALIEANLNKWDRNTSVRTMFPKELISVLYDDFDTVLFGSNTIKGLVSYHYIDAKYSTDGKPIYLNSCVTYDGVGNASIKDKSLIKSFAEIKNFLEK